MDLILKKWRNRVVRADPQCLAKLESVKPQGVEWPQSLSLTKRQQALHIAQQIMNGSHIGHGLAQASSNPAFCLSEPCIRAPEQYVTMLNSVYSTYQAAGESTQMTREMRELASNLYVDLKHLNNPQVLLFGMAVIAVREKNANEEKAQLKMLQSAFMTCVAKSNFSSFSPTKRIPEVERLVALVNSAKQELLDDYISSSLSKEPEVNQQYLDPIWRRKLEAELHQMRLSLEVKRLVNENGRVTRAASKRQAEEEPSLEPDPKKQPASKTQAEEQPSLESDPKKQPVDEFETFASTQLGLLNADGSRAENINTSSSEDETLARVQQSIASKVVDHYCKESKKVLLKSPHGTVDNDDDDDDDDGKDDDTSESEDSSDKECIQQAASDLLAFVLKNQALNKMYSAAVSAAPPELPASSHLAGTFDVILRDSLTGAEVVLSTERYPPKETVQLLTPVAAKALIQTFHNLSVTGGQQAAKKCRHDISRNLLENLLEAIDDRPSSNSSLFVDF